MFFLKKIAYRTFQLAFRIALPILPYREPRILSSCSDLGEVFKSEKISSVLVVTDSGIVKNGLLTPLIDVLLENGVKCTVYDKTQPNPTVKNVEEALSVYHGNKCDALIAIGGGSAMDAAKAVGAGVVYPKRSLNKMGGILKVLRRIPTLIAIPTTAGTGSEVTLAAVITDSDTHHKYALMSFPLIPRYAVLDPALTYTLPPHMTATTGMDALTHAVEAYIGRSGTKETKALALGATKLVFENVKTAYEDGKNHKARENMLRASYLAGKAFTKSYVGYVHAVAHSLGGQYGIPHGLANAVLLPNVLEAYGETVYKKLHRLAVLAGLCDASAAEETGAKAFIAAIRDMNRRMGIPTVLSGIRAEDIPVMARHAAAEANPLYPVPVLWDASGLERFYAQVTDQERNQ